MAIEIWQAVRLSLIVAFWSTLISLPFAIFIAYVLARYEFWGKALLNGLVHISLILPPVVTGYLLLKTFGRQGWIGKPLDECCGIVFAFEWTGAVIAAAVMAFPLMIRAIRQSIEAIHPEMERAARSLGASHITSFFRITLPLASPGIIVGAVLGFAKAMGEFGATITFVSNIPGRTQTIPLAIHSELQSVNGDRIVLIFVLISIAISLIALTIAEKLGARARQRLF